METAREYLISPSGLRGVFFKSLLKLVLLVVPVRLEKYNRS